MITIDLGDFLDIESGPQNSLGIEISTGNDVRRGGYVAPTAEHDANTLDDENPTK